MAFPFNRFSDGHILPNRLPPMAAGYRYKEIASQKFVSLETVRTHVMERLIKANNIDLALSSNITPFNIAAATVCEKYKMFYAINTSWIDEIEKLHFKYASDMFSSAAEAARTPYLIWESWPKDKRPQRPVIMMLNTPDGQVFGAGQTV